MYVAKDADHRYICNLSMVSKKLLVKMRSSDNKKKHTYLLLFDMCVLLNKLRLVKVRS
jgi:hypothetical protein